jgi:DNA invertase Pin-like site-specific DNA recombinase
MRSLDDYQTVQDLIAGGMNDCAIARETRIRRTTVSTFATAGT